jgi:pimeloyl-ACP methyl ester carboxylesterase
MLHGQPGWSYLYRKMIPAIAAAGNRVIAVDYLGMGRSDKPIDLSFHTFEHHVKCLKHFLDALDLSDITLFCQNWGSLAAHCAAARHLSSMVRSRNATTDACPRTRDLLAHALTHVVRRIARRWLEMETPMPPAAMAQFVQRFLRKGLAGFPSGTPSTP